MKLSPYHGMAKIIPTSPPQSWRSTAPNKYLLPVLTCLVLSSFLALTALQRSVTPTPSFVAPLSESGSFTWETRSHFSPVRFDNASNMTISELCESFPTHLLDSIQPVLKTGHGVVAQRLPPQMRSVSACLTNLLIFSDFDEEIQDRQLKDVISDIASSMVMKNSQLKAYRAQLGLGMEDNPHGKNMTPAQGWKTDKFKFLPGISRAWRTRSNRSWYVFFEDDTFVVWDNVFRLLANFDPDIPYYFGSPTPGHKSTWFANGGPGIILSGAAMKRLTANDWNTETGEYLGTRLTEKYWKRLLDDCCGDSVLGWALANENVTLSGLFPMFNPHPPQGVPFSDDFWCQPVLTMHKPARDDLEGLWRWQFEHRDTDVSAADQMVRLSADCFQRPLLYRDMAVSYFKFDQYTISNNWDNGGRGGFAPPLPSPFYDYSPHESIDACNTACEAHPDCLQWNYHLRECWFVNVMRVGFAREPEVEGWRNKAVKNVYWTAEEESFVAGWATESIRRWVDDRPCDIVDWVRPSVQRIF